jgi:hypothetical protein
MKLFLEQQSEQSKLMNFNASKFFNKAGTGIKIPVLQSVQKPLIDPTLKKIPLSLNYRGMKDKIIQKQMNRQ